SPLLAEGLRRMRAGEVIREGGYDGEYGVIRVFQPGELESGKSVSLLFDLPAAVKPAGAALRRDRKQPAPEESQDESTPAIEETETREEAATAAPPVSSCEHKILAGLDPDQRAAA